MGFQRVEHDLVTKQQQQYGSDGKASVYNAGDLGLIPGSGRFPEEGNGNPQPVFLSGKSHGQRSLVGYSPWGHKELDTTEQLHVHHK